jgi:pimeloyl-ACP methyl ester carboxylesterase
MRKAMARNNAVVVFVPGGLGSKLALGKQLVWSDGREIHCSLRMLQNPSLLLPWVPLNSPDVLRFYDPFISFLGQCGYYVKRGNLKVYPYDWRVSLEETGDGLNRYIVKELLPELGDKKIIFICHSLGCMVVRWALLYSTTDIRGSVERVIAAAPPGLGIAGAFREMVEVTIGSSWLYAKILALIKLLAGYDIDIPIIRVSRTITSLLDLLPPNFLPILTNGSGGHIGAFNWTGWPDELLELRKGVQARHARRGNSWGAVNRTLIASNQHPTETSYVLKADDSGIASALCEGGDASITYTSARAYMDLTPTQRVAFPDTEVLVASTHGGLLNDSAARTEIMKFI